MTEIEVDNFSVQGTNEFIYELLSMESTQTEELVELCHRRSSGNVFFLKEFLSMLKNELLLEYDIGVGRWKWDTSRIEEQTVVTTNILQLIETRLKKMKPELLLMLKISACLGNQFDRRILEKILSQYAENVEDDDHDRQRSLESIDGLKRFLKVRRHIHADSLMIRYRNRSSYS
jgi:predicted ATPase